MKGLADIESTARVQIRRERLEHLPQRPVVYRGLEVAMTRLIDG